MHTALSEHPSQYGTAVRGFAEASMGDDDLLLSLSLNSSSSWSARNRAVSSSGNAEGAILLALAECCTVSPQDSRGKLFARLCDSAKAAPFAGIPPAGGAGRLINPRSSSIRKKKHLAAVP